MSTDASPVLALPYIMPSQAQKHVTHNEAIRTLDLLVQPTALSATLSLPPAGPADGDRYIVGPAAGGDWAGRDGQIACFDLTAWVFLAPARGWVVRLLDDLSLRVFDGAVWTLDPGLAGGLDRLGLNTAADAQNRLAVASANTLLTHDGADHRLKINKAAAADTASLLFQTGWSGRAEMGTTGSDDFAIKASADGSSFAEALVVRAASGRVDLPQGVQIAAGSAAAPGLGFLEHPATGLTAGPDGALSLVVGGTGVARCTATGAELTGRLTGTAVAQSASDTTPGRLLTTLPGWQQLDPSLYRRGNAVGPVSQSAGQPTGAIVERGSTAAGEFTRWADGTQICACTVSTSASAAVTQAWPVAFATAPRVTATPVSATAALATVSAIGTGSADVSGFALSGARIALPVQVLAFGRWV